MSTVAVVGGGWAGLAAAVRALQRGHRVSVFETAASWGGRARSVAVDGLVLDNGQHILIGAYVRTLALMRDIGVDPDTALRRLPLTLVDAAGDGLALPPGPALPSFVRGVLGCRGWTLGDRLALLAAAAGWALHGFRCAPALTVAQLCRRLPPRVRATLIDPLCVAALNTTADTASAAVLLRVLHDALFVGRGGADLLLATAPLGTLLPEPAARWLARAGAQLHPGTRVRALERDGAGWRVGGGEHCDAVVLAAGAVECARLAQPHAPAWAATAAALSHEPIVTVYLRCDGARLPLPMLTLRDAPAQFAFDRGGGVFGFVVSGARGSVEQGLAATADAVLRQAATLLPGATLVRTLADKRATFVCTPALQRPPMQVAPGLLAAGDFVAGPYPATLEGAVRSGEAAAAAL